MSFKLYSYLPIAATVLLLIQSCTTSSVLVPTEIASTPKVDNDSDSAPLIDKDISQLQDAQPKPVVRTRAGNKSPYTVLGKTYTLLPDSKGYKELGYASWYGTKFHGRRTANGEVYDMWGMTAAHKTLPIPSYVRVTNVANGESVVVLVNDRGPFHDGRIIDLSYAAALKLGFAKKGVAQVEVVDVTPTQATVPLKPQEPANGQLNEVPVAATPDPIIDSSHTFLQVAAFKQASNAKKLREKLSGILSVPVNVVPSADNVWHRVQAGPIVGQQQLLETRQLLFEQGIANPQTMKK